MEAKERTSDNVRAVNRALDLLLAFTRDDFELTASELLQRVALSRPTLYRLLYTLETRGFITSSGDPQRFRLGPAIAQLSHVWTGTLDLALLAEPMMRRLWLTTRETVAIFVAQDSMRLCLAELPSPQPLNFKRGVGYTERIALGASGRAILAFMPDADKGLDRYTHGMKVDAKKFRAELVVTRERGYAVSRSELIDGAVAVAAPFFNANGVAGSIGIYGPDNRMGEQQVEVWGKAIVAEAGELSGALGVPA
jgi:DNA-binding IclR family transcriptional regulator